MSVYGWSKNSEADVSFGHDNPGADASFYMGGDWLTQNVTLPGQGFESMTFVWTVPPSYDDLSAAVSARVCVCVFLLCCLFVLCAL